MHPQAVGLPQDALADCSRILSNFYLQKYDQFASEICSQADATYFRYADDQMILLKNPNLVNNILLLLTRNLDRYGLRVNQKKVILWATPDLIRHRCREIQAIFIEPKDRENPILVRKFANAYLALSSYDLAKTWNGGTPLMNRLLWAKIELLPQSLLHSLMMRLTSESFLLQADSKKLERIDYLNKIRKTPVDFRQHIRFIAIKSVHNIFHHEARRYAIKMQDVELEMFLNKRISDLRRIMDLNIVEHVKSAA